TRKPTTAPMLADKANFSEIDVNRWLSTLNGATEEADLLCHSLLRHLSFADRLITTLIQSEEPIKRYIGLRLLFSKVAENPDIAIALAKSELERDEPLTRAIAFQIINEANYLKEGI
ncbi:MAG: hypothetical protein K2K84_04345, partial [Muribaculaceae bacterium]|nr:hypothetical protein [Muribaculaceae bacterium]